MAFSKNIYNWLGTSNSELSLLDFLGLHGVAWGCMGLHGVAWGCMGLHGVAWGCMGLHMLRIVCRANESRNLSVGPIGLQKAWPSGKSHKAFEHFP